MLAAQAPLKQTNTSQSFGRRGAFRPASWLEKINAAKLSAGNLSPNTDLGNSKKWATPNFEWRGPPVVSQMLQYHKNHY